MKRNSRKLKKPNLSFVKKEPSSKAGQSHLIWRLQERLMRSVKLSVMRLLKKPTKIISLMIRKKTI